MGSLATALLTGTVVVVTGFTVVVVVVEDFTVVVVVVDFTVVVVAGDVEFVVVAGFTVVVVVVVDVVVGDVEVVPVLKRAGLPDTQGIGSLLDQPMGTTSTLSVVVR